MAKICIHCYVSGKVHGVWYRASTQEKAQELGLTGWVRNLSDGRVEVLACGEEEQVESLYAWLQHGPDLASVDSVSREDISLEEHSSFVVQ